MKSSDKLQLGFENSRQNLYLLVMDPLGNPIGLMPTSISLPRGAFETPSKRADFQVSVPRYGQKWGLPGQSLGEEEVLPLVESALKHLYDLVYLGEHPLTQLQIVQTSHQAKNLPQGHLEYAKTLSALLTDAIQQLKPSGPVPSQSVIPGRRWHPYLILYTAYIEGDDNALIMRWLQISEGTFNRSRRRALHAVAKTIMEMEAHVRGHI